MENETKVPKELDEGIKLNEIPSMYVDGIVVSIQMVKRSPDPKDKAVVMAEIVLFDWRTKVVAGRFTTTLVGANSFAQTLQREVEMFKDQDQG